LIAWRFSEAVRRLVDGGQFISDLLQTILDGEMSGIEAVHLRYWKSVKKGLAVGRRKEDIVLSPEDDRFRLGRREADSLTRWLDGLIITAI
jgi:hypothetical protein